jgi:tetratricopeptide (TPR) repeat protein
MYLLRKAIDLKPDYADAYNALGGAYTDQGTWEQAVRNFKRSLELNPAAGNVHRNLGLVYMNTQQWREALDELQSAIRHGGIPAGDSELFFRHDLATLLLLAGKDADYRRLCEDVLRRHGKTKETLIAHLAARICGLSAGSVADLERPVRLAEKALADERRAYHLYALGITLYRAGRLEMASEQFHQSLNTDPNWAGVAANYFGLAMAYQRQGKTDEARRWLTKGISWIEQNDPRKPGRRVAGRSALYTQDWVGAHALRREAQVLVLGK